MQETDTKELNVMECSQHDAKQQGKANWWDGNGRPTKEQLIREYMISNPDVNKKSEIAAALHIDRHTVANPGGDGESAHNGRTAASDCYRERENCCPPCSVAGTERSDS